MVEGARGCGVSGFTVMQTDLVFDNARAAVLHRANARTARRRGQHHRELAHKRFARLFEHFVREEADRVITEGERIEHNRSIFRGRG